MKEKVITKPEIKGDLIFDGKLIFKNNCAVFGSIKAEIIIAEKSIEAGWYIEAGGSIEAGRSIKAGEHVFTFRFRVRAKSITTNLLPFWRNYWAEMPPLKKWRKLILDESRCWDDYRKAISKAEAKKICAWNGWHWLIRAHLEMFFGLKDSVVPPEEK